MKASLKFRDDEKPLFRAKIPLSVLGFPFQSGVSAGDSKELSLNLSTFFESGPSLKISYRPNDSWNPFSLIVKTGIGHFGSPITSPMTMSAEFNLLGNGNPSFFLHFRPQIGDFSIKKSAGSQISLSSTSTVFLPKMKSHAIDPDSDPGEPIDGGKTQLDNGVYHPENGIFSGEKVDGFSPATHGVGAIDRLLTGVELSAKTTVPVRNRALLNFQWGVKFPSEYGMRNPTAEISIRKIPSLVLRKFGIEHVAKEDCKEGTKWDPAIIAPVNADLAEVCFTVKRQLDLLQAENSLLIKAMEELRSEFGAGKLAPVTGSMESGDYWGKDRSSGKSSSSKKDRRSEGKTSEFGGLAGKVTNGDVNQDGRS